MYGHDYTWTLEKPGTVLNISSQGRLFYSDSTNANEFIKYNRYDPTNYAYINASEIQHTIFKRPYHYEGAPYHYWSMSYLQERMKMWELVLTSNVFVKIGSKGNVSIIVRYLLYCIQSNTLFNFAYFMAKTMVGMRTNDRLILYARLLTWLFEVAKEKYTYLDHFVTCKGVDLIFSTFNASTLEQTDIEYAWLDEDTWIRAKEEISSDEVIEKDAMDKLSFRDNMAYKLVPSCFVIFDLEPLSLSVDFIFTSEIFKSLSFSLDRLCRLVILCLDRHAYTLHHLESLLIISLDNHCLNNLDILKEDLKYQSLQKASQSRQYACELDDVKQVFVMECVLMRFIVGIKRLLDDLRVTAAQVCVTAAKLKLVLFINFNEKSAK
ncbi:hypothetical protein Tco_1168524 [Tanacetum coccineum]